MEKLCILCGTPLGEDGKCPVCSQIKKMCLNCTHCGEGEDGSLLCNNPEYLSAAVEKVRASLPSGYEFKQLELQPIPLKKPTRFCEKWTISEKAKDELERLFR